MWAFPRERVLLVSVLVLELARVLQEKALAVSVPVFFLVVGLVLVFLQGRVASRLPVSYPVLMVVGLLWEARVPALGVSFPASWEMEGVVDCLEEVSETAFDFVWVSDSLVEKISERASDLLVEKMSEKLDSLVEMPSE